MLTVISAAICIIIVAVIIYYKKQFRYWKDLGIPGPEPSLFMGNVGDIYSLKAPEPMIIDEWYKKFKDEPFVGYFSLWKPTLLVRDPELIKTISEIDFNHFMDHPTFCGTTKTDSVMDSILTMKGEKWRSKHQIFTRLFAPKRLKEYCEIMNRYCTPLLEDIDSYAKRGEEVPLPEITKRYMIRTTSHILYGLDVSEYKEIYSELYYNSELFARPPFSTVLIFFLFSIAPRLLTFLRLRTFPKEHWNFFSNFASNLFKSRNDGKMFREDLVSLVGEMQKGGIPGNEKIGFEEAVGHLFTFFVGAHDTTYTTMTFALFQLSRYPEVQEKLRKEVDDVLAGDDNVSFDNVMKMKYLDKVINETMRTYTVVGVIKRTCNLPYKVNDKFTIPKGMDIMFPAYSIHMDPEHFPDPEEFIPERFSETEKLPSAFMPFGRGPRTCIGKRLAYMLLKISLAKIVSNYIILPSPSIELPMEYDPRAVLITCRPVQTPKVIMQRRQKEAASKI